MKKLLSILTSQFVKSAFFWALTASICIYLCVISEIGCRNSTDLTQPRKQYVSKIVMTKAFEYTFVYQEESELKTLYFDDFYQKPPIIIIDVKPDHMCWIRYVESVDGKSKELKEIHIRKLDDMNNFQLESKGQ